MNTRTIYSGATCYTRPGDDSNPYREHLELQVLEGGEEDTFFWIEDAGNGCAGGYALEDIDGWSDADINERFQHIDLDVLRDDCAAIRAMGRSAEADWLEAWIDRAEEAR